MFKLLFYQCFMKCFTYCGSFVSAWLIKQPGSGKAHQRWTYSRRVIDKVQLIMDSPDYPLHKSFISSLEYYNFNIFAS